MGDVIFYHNERFFVEPPACQIGQHWVRIGDKRVPRERHPNGEWGLAKERLSFYVHLDELTLSPIQPRNAASALPTLASIARADRARHGVRDVGDEVAVLLRSCDSLDKVYATAAEYLGVARDELVGKYSHLNHGQQRMNLGNRMRAKWRKEHGL